MSTYKEYFVEWNITISARSPEEAANIARQIQLDPQNTATHFYVSQEDDGEANGINADMNPSDYTYTEKGA